LDSDITVTLQLEPRALLIVLVRKFFYNLHVSNVYWQHVYMINLSLATTIQNMLSFMFKI